MQGDLVVWVPSNALALVATVWVPSNTLALVATVWVPSNTLALVAMTLLTVPKWISVASPSALFPDLVFATAARVRCFTRFC